MKKHRLDPVSVLFGSIFTVIGALYVGGGADVHAALEGSWILPVALIFVGVVVVGSALRRERDPDG